MSSLSYLLCPASREADFDVPAGNYCVPIGWVLGFGADATVIAPGRVEGPLASARERWARVLESPDAYLRGVLGPVRLVLDRCADGDTIAIDATELVGVNPADDGFEQRLALLGEEATAAIEAGARDRAVAVLNRWEITGTLRFSGSGAADRQWIMNLGYVRGDTAEQRWGPLVAGEVDEPGWLEATAAAVQFV